MIGASFAASAQTLPRIDEELLRQQQRDRALEQRQQATPDVRLERARSEPDERLPADEKPCFTIRHIELTGDAAERFQWALAAADQADDQARGRCLGTTGINHVMKRIQNAIVERGYVTTRILAGSQDLTSGKLTLTLVPGRLRAIRSASGEPLRVSFGTAFPMQAGDLLNLRDIEQALENLKRVPTAEADIQIAPSEGEAARPGDSDLIVNWKQRFPARLTLGLDDGGSKATGRYQGNVTLSLDNLLTLSDLFYATYHHDMLNQSGRGTDGYALHYSLPFGYWLLGLNAAESYYHQTVAGASQNYVYSGRSSNRDIRLSRIVWRDAIGKTTIGGRIWQRASQSYIDDTEIAVQQRRTAGGEISLSEKLFLRATTLDGTLAYRWGTGALGSLPAPEERFGEGTSRPRLITIDAQLNHAFSLAALNLRYNLAWRGQWNQTPLVPQDRFAIGGRYTVRGFDGESLLTGDHGWLIRNDLGLALGSSGQEAYIGIDHGRVGGPSSDFLVGKELTGAVLGVRGNLHGANYDLFVGQPIAKPEHFRGQRTTVGFTLNWTL